MVSPLIAASSPSVFRHIYDNGLVTLIQPSHKAETVSIYLAVKTGASDEEEWQGSGLSHFVEHMFFKGTQKRSKGQIEFEIRQMGGSMNAYTSHDTTVFYASVLSEHALSALELVYDAAFSSTFDMEELEKEREVILSEFRMIEDRLDQKTVSTLWQSLFLWHPYKHPVIGYMNLFKEVSREDLLSFYKKHYVPNNMVLSVVGHVDAAEVQKHLDQTFGAQPRMIYEKHLNSPEPPPVSSRKSILYRPAEHARLVIGFRTVPFYHKDSAALDLLAHIMGEGAHSRLYQRVKEEQNLVLDISASHSSLREAGVFIVDALVKPELLDKAREAILAELRAIEHEKITPQELEIAVKQFVSGYYGQLESHASMAHDLLVNEVYTGDYDYSKKNIQNLRQVTAVDIGLMADRYLDERILSEVLLLPKSLESSARQSTNASLKSNVIQKEVLRPGLTLLLMEDASVPTVDLNWVSRGGVLLEKANQSGLSTLTADMLMRGTRRHSQKELAELVASWGGHFSASSGQNSISISLSCLKEYQAQAVALLNEIITEPLFAEEEFQKAQENQLQAIAAESEDIFQSMMRQFLREMYGEEHPYGKYSLGTREDVEAYTVDDVKRFFTTVLEQQQAVVGVFGDLNAADLKKEWPEFLRRVPAGKKKEVLTPIPLGELQTKKVDLPLPREQALSIMGFRTASSLDPDRYALQVLNTTLGGTAGRLFQNIRGNHGLAYSVSSSLQMGLLAGHALWYAACEPQKEEAVLALFHEEMERLRTDGLSANEIEMAKSEILGHHQTMLESKASLLYISTANELFGLGYEETFRFSEGIQAVEKTDVDRVIQKYIRPDQTLQVLVHSEMPVSA